MREREGETGRGEGRDGGDDEGNQKVVTEIGFFLLESIKPLLRLPEFLFEVRRIPFEVLHFLSKIPPPAPSSVFPVPYSCGVDQPPKGDFVALWKRISLRWFEVPRGFAVHVWKEKPLWRCCDEGT